MRTSSLLVRHLPIVIPVVPVIPRPHCYRTFWARIGFVSHIRTHRPTQPPPRRTNNTCSRFIFAIYGNESHSPCPCKHLAHQIAVLMLKALRSGQVLPEFIVDTAFDTVTSQSKIHIFLPSKIHIVLMVRKRNNSLILGLFISMVISSQTLTACLYMLCFNVILGLVKFLFSCVFVYGNV